jgi:hypothetical protein
MDMVRADIQGEQVPSSVGGVLSDGGFGRGSGFIAQGDRFVPKSLSRRSLKARLGWAPAWAVFAIDYKRAARIAREPSPVSCPSDEVGRRVRHGRKDTTKYN